LGVGEIGLNAQGLLEVCARLGRLALPTEHHAQVVGSVGKIGLDA